MRSSILILMGAVALGGCSRGKEHAQTTPEQTVSPSGAEGASPPPMPGQEMQGQEQSPGPGMPGQEMQGQEQSPGPGMPGQEMQGQAMQGTQGMHDGHGHGADTAGGTGAAHDMSAMCPMQVQGTTARAEDTATGVAVVFTTTGDVTELRRRVAHMAEMHNQYHGQGATTETQGQQQGAQGQNRIGAQGQTGTTGGPEQAMMTAQARAEDIDRGVRVVFTPQNPAQLSSLRQQVRQHVQQMVSSGQCSMMESQGQTGTTGTQGQTGTTGRPRG